MYKRQPLDCDITLYTLKTSAFSFCKKAKGVRYTYEIDFDNDGTCLLYTSDAADERSSVDLGGRRIIKKKKTKYKRKQNPALETNH